MKKHLLDQLKVHFYDWLSLDAQRCLAFGDMGKDDNGVYVRVCEKNRWHIDSHEYVFEELSVAWRKDTF